MGPLRRAASRIGGDDALRRIARGGAEALLIKIAAGGLAVLMFLVVARITSVEAFGRFGFGYSLAMVLAKLGSMGQRMLVLRYAPAFHADGDAARLAGVLRFGYVAVSGGCVVAGLVLIGVGLAWPGLGPTAALAATAALILAMGLAEYQAHALRAVAGMTLALAPRDLGSRLLVIAAAGGLLALGARLSSAEALGLLCAALVLTTLGQAALHPLTRPRSLLHARAVLDLPEWRRVSARLWAGSVLHADVNMLMAVAGALLDPAAFGLLFTAMRLALLLELTPLAAAMVAAAQISRRWHAGDRAGIGRICAFAAGLATLPALGAALVFALAGTWILELFGPAYGAAWPLLMVLTAAFVAKAALGPAVMVLQLAGQERSFMVIAAASNLAALAALAALAPTLGAPGAAIGIGVGVLSTFLAAHLKARAALGVDTSVLGAARGFLRGRATRQ